MPNNDYANAGDQSRAERILSSIINGPEYDEPVQSRLEYLLLQLLGTLDAKADLDEDGLIPVSEIPPQAFEYMVDVADDTARFALTTDDVQKGDIVRVISTGIMYIVVDETHLSTEAGYKPFAAGIAAKAIGDEDGNNIKQTYQPKIDANNKLPADNVVLTGYVVDDARSNITASSSVRDAVEQLEYREELNKTNILSITNHITFSANSKTYYLQPEQPSNPVDGDIWIG